MSNITGSVKDWTFFDPLGTLLLTLDTHHAPPAVVHAEETHHPSARKLQSLPGKQAASGNFERSARSNAWENLAADSSNLPDGWQNEFQAMTDSNLARGLTPTLSDSEMTSKNNSSVSSICAARLVLNLCILSALWSLWSSGDLLWPDVFATDKPNNSRWLYMLSRIVASCHCAVNTKKSSSWYKYCKWDHTFRPRRLQTLIFLSALLCSLASQMESAHRIVNWDQYLKYKIANSNYQPQTDLISCDPDAAKFQPLRQQETPHWLEPLFDSLFQKSLPNTSDHQANLANFTEVTSRKYVEPWCKFAASHCSLSCYYSKTWKSERTYDRLW